MKKKWKQQVLIFVLHIDYIVYIWSVSLYGSYDHKILWYDGGGDDSDACKRRRCSGRVYKQFHNIYYDFNTYTHILYRYIYTHTLITIRLRLP